MQAINQGIADFSVKSGPWRIDMNYFAKEGSVVEFVRARQYQGVIFTYMAPYARAIEAAGIPVVNALVSDEVVPSVTIDEQAVGRLGAEHLLQCGYKRFAFFGTKEPWSTARYEGFSSAILRQRDATVLQNVPCTLVNYGSSNEIDAAVGSCVDSLQPPVAIMACNDGWASRLTGHAIERGLRVPGDIAVLGVDNDLLLCETGACPLSSIDTDLHHVGFEAAHLLERRMRGESVSGNIPRIRPRAVVCRQSTSLFSHDDIDIASAMRFLYERACEGITVDDVCKHVALSRRTLEKRFTRAVGHSPGHEIRQIRIDRAKALLEETSMTLAEISIRCGYAYISGFATAFRSVVGVSPGEYRKVRHVPQ
jgi:LacI family transcriptional regulator